MAPIVVGMLACWYGVCLLLLRQRRLQAADAPEPREGELAKADTDGAASELSTLTRERQELRDTSSWVVQLDLGEEELEMKVGKKAIKDVKALKRAIANACIASQGSSRAPRKWTQAGGRAIGMQIQYLDYEDEFKTLTPLTPFLDVRKSLRLNVMPT